MNLKNAKVNEIFLKFPKSIFVFIILLVTASLSYDMPYRAIALLPLSYMIIDFFLNRRLKKKNVYTGGLLYKVALIVIFMRYVITPFSIAVTQIFYVTYGQYTVHVTRQSINLAVLLMVIELVCVYATLYLSRAYYSNNKNNLIPNKIGLLKHKFILILFLLITIPVLVVVEPTFIVPRDFLILDSQFENTQLEVAFSGLFFMLSRIVRPVVFLAVFSELKQRYDVSRSKVYMWASILLLGLFIVYHTGTVRFELVFAGIIALYLFKLIYKKIPKFVVLSLMLMVVVGFFSASLLKFTWTVKGSDTPIKDITIEIFGMFQNYFSGPALVATSIEMKDAYINQINSSTFINDFTGSIPVISNYVDQSNRINAYFNRYTGRPYGHNTQIIPLVGIGYVYFPVFPWIFTIMCYWFVVKFDYKLQKSASIEYKYLYLYPGLYLSMGLGFNTQIIFTTLIQRFLPLFLLFKLNSKICLSKSNNEKSYHERRLDLTKPY
jgi:uncharacterized membrane protein